jgi:hypothetical protein
MQFPAIWLADKEVIDLDNIFIICMMLQDGEPGQVRADYFLV